MASDVLPGPFLVVAMGGVGVGGGGVTEFPHPHLHRLSPFFVSMMMEL